MSNLLELLKDYSYIMNKYFKETVGKIIWNDNIRTWFKKQTVEEVKVIASEICMSFLSGVIHKV